MKKVLLSIDNEVHDKIKRVSHLEGRSITKHLEILIRNIYLHYNVDLTRSGLILEPIVNKADEDINEL